MSDSKNKKNVERCLRKTLEVNFTGKYSSIHTHRSPSPHRTGKDKELGCGLVVAHLL